MTDVEDRARQIKEAASNSVRARIEAEKADRVRNLELLRQLTPTVGQLCKRFAKAFGWQLTKEEVKWRNNLCTTFLMSRIVVCINVTPSCLSAGRSFSFRGITVGLSGSHWDHYPWVKIPFDEFSEGALLEELTKLAEPLVEWEKYQHERGKKRYRKFFDF